MLPWRPLTRWPRSLYLLSFLGSSRRPIGLLFVAVLAARGGGVGATGKGLPASVAATWLVQWAIWSLVATQRLNAVLMHTIVPLVAMVTGHASWLLQVHDCVEKKIKFSYCALQVGCLEKLGNGTCLCHYYQLKAFVACRVTELRHLRATAYLPFPLDNNWLAKHSK